MHYVCSDIHGQYDLFMRLLKTIQFNEDDIMYVLGDAIDRGPANIAVLQEIMKHKNIEFFLGNHELMMWDHIYRDKRIDGRSDIWFIGNNGGKLTMAEFNKLSDHEQKEILEYIKNAWIQKYVTVDGVDFALCHSCFISHREGENVRFCDEKHHDTVFDAVWNSPYRFWEYADISWYNKAYTYIIGHVPVQVENLEKPPLVQENVIDIDGGCALIPRKYNGGLYCMTLEKDQDNKPREFWITP